MNDAPPIKTAIQEHSVPRIFRLDRQLAACSSVHSRSLPKADHSGKFGPQVSRVLLMILGPWGVSSLQVRQHLKGVLEGFVGEPVPVKRYWVKVDMSD